MQKKEQNLLQKNIGECLKTVFKTTKKSNSFIKTGDYLYLQTYSSFLNQMNDLSDTILNTINICTQFLKLDPEKSILNEKTHDEKYKIMSHLIGDIVDLIDKHIDDAIEDRKAKKDDKTRGIIKKVGNFKIFHAKQVMRPQFTFQDKIDNFGPFIPKFPAKKNSLIQTNSNENNPQNHLGNTENSHLYEYEILHSKLPNHLFEIPEQNSFLEIQDTPLIFVDTLEKFKEIISHLKKEKEIGVEVENHVYHSYQGFICILKISTRKQDILIDTIKLRSNINEMNEIFTDSNIIKIFNNGSEQILHLQRDFNVYVVNMFDLFISSSLLLDSNDHSIADVIKIFLNIQIEHEFDLVDWRIRPLPKEVLEFARQELHYFIPLYDKLRSILIMKAKEENQNQNQNQNEIQNQNQNQNENQNQNQNQNHNNNNNNQNENENENEIEKEFGFELKSIFDYGERSKEVKKLQKAVYRVREIPDSFFDHIFDFGSLDDESEKFYLNEMIKQKFRNNWGFTQDEINESIELFRHLLSKTHQFAKLKLFDIKTPISLRDAARTLKIWEYLLNDGLTLNLFIDPEEFRAMKQSKFQQKKRKMMIGIILSIFISYGCRFPDNLRSDYYSYILQDIKITPFFHYLQPAFPTTTNEFLEAINQLRTQFFRNIDDKSYLKSQGIIPNEALTENLLVEFICIQTKIPLFIIGKPGTSKSLSIDILKNWLSNSSNNEYVREGKLKRIQVFPLQCSPQTTPRAIEKIFEQARNYKQQQREYLENREYEEFQEFQYQRRGNVPVVLLDEVALAEMNPEFPLKVLHKELELSDQDARRDEDKFPVIAISNWKLDASKTNRGIFLQRYDPDKEELKETGKSIFGSIFIESIYKPSKKEFKIPEKLAEIYFEIFQIQQKKIKKTEESEERIIRENFFGLRDFYYLIKMIGYDMKDKKEKGKKNECSKQEILEIVFQSFLRNFGGASKKFFDEIIQPLLKKYGYWNDEIMKKKSTMNLITDNLEINPNEQEIKSRHIMIICEEMTILPLIIEKLKKDIKERNIKLLYGSYFNEDKEIQTYHDLKNVANLIADTNIIVLCNQEQLFEPLYDVLNQRYTVIGNKYISNISFGASTTRVFINPASRIVVIMPKERAYTDLSPAILNQFEKQLVTSNDILNEIGKNYQQEIQNYFGNIKKITSTKTSQLLAGFHPDLISSLSFKLQEKESKLTKQKTIPHQDYWHKIAKLGTMIHLKKHLIQKQEKHEKLNEFEETLQKDLDNYSQNTASDLKDLLDKISKKENEKENNLIILTNSPPFDLENFYKNETKNYTIINITNFEKTDDFNNSINSHLKEENKKAIFIQFEISSDKNIMKSFQHIKSLIESNENFEKKERQTIILFVHLSSSENQTFRICFEEKWEIYYLDDLNPDFKTIDTFLLPFDQIYKEKEKQEKQEQQEKQESNLFHKIHQFSLQKLNKNIDKSDKIVKELNHPSRVLPEEYQEQLSLQEKQTIKTEFQKLESKIKNKLFEGLDKLVKILIEKPKKPKSIKEDEIFNELFDNEFITFEDIKKFENFPKLKLSKLVNFYRFCEDNLESN